MTKKVIEELVGDVTDAEAEELENQLREDELTQEEDNNNNEDS